MNITYKKATARQLSAFHRLIEEAKKSRLYVVGWYLCCLLYSYAQMRKVPDCCSIVIAYDGDVPIGVCLMYDRHENGIPTSATFVRKAYRRHGIGTALIRKALPYPTAKFYYEVGLQEATPFFNQFASAQRVGYY